MPSLSFKKEFVPAVEFGLIMPFRGYQTLSKRLDYFRNAHPQTIHFKRNTIRRVRSKPIKPGDTLQLYTAMRTRYCRKLGEVTCHECLAIEIHKHSASCFARVKIKGIGWLTQCQLQGLAKMDGFKDWAAMFDFFSENYPLPFKGVLLTW